MLWFKIFRRVTFKTDKIRSLASTEVSWQNFKTFDLLHPLKFRVFKFEILNLLPKKGKRNGLFKLHIPNKQLSKSPFNCVWFSLIAPTVNG